PSHSGVAHLCAPMLDAFFVPPQFALEESADSEFLLFGQIILPLHFAMATKFGLFMRFLPKSYP
ncbi:MAG: hypothetical protein ACRD5F_11180, partial [Candidatus Acidiferrales bacterium]